MIEHPCITQDPEIRAAYAADVSGLSHIPDAVARPESEAEVADLLHLCADRRIAVTAQGLRSSTTGASVAFRGIVLSLEKLHRVLDIDPARRRAVAEPGVVTAEFKRQVAAAGLFYPPDPTSEEESTLGGNVACNASGSRTYRYGPTRRYVRGLRIVLAGGRITHVARIGANKNAAGYFGLQNPIDLWIGSEGTLGIITQLEVDLIEAPPAFFGAMAFFRDWRDAIGFVLRSDASRRRGELDPRCLEFFGEHALNLAAPAAERLRIPANARAAIFFEEEVAPEAIDGALERWHRAIEDAGGLADETVIARTTAEQAALRALRHAVPSTMQERGLAAAAGGGRRVSTDFAVPLHQLPTLMEEAFQLMETHFGGPTVAYGHVGNGHPHFNLLAEDPPSLQRAEETARRMAEVAMRLGGTLSAEHGIGKVKTHFYRDLYPEWMLSAMRGVKRALDPRGILAPGNLLDD